MIFNMEINKENLNELRNNPLAHFIANTLGVDLSKLIEDAEKQIEKEEKASKPIEEPVEKKRDFNELYKKIAEQQKKQYVAPKCEQGRSFIMTKEQFKDFCSKYEELIGVIRKIEYFYGISFNAETTKPTLYNMVSSIIWNFVRIIFGDDNADDIADFLYGNSNFDSAESLYDELV